MRFIFILISLLAQPSLASLSDAVVKTFSKDNRSEVFLEGSGTLFQYQDKTYVLTSEHVIYSTNQKASHYIYHTTAGKIPARFVVSNLLNGLSLLEVDLPSPLTALPMESLFLGDLHANDSVTAIGFPLRLTKFILAKGVYQKFWEEQEILAAVSGLHVVKKMASEFGMSGGALFDVNENFSGTISHQTYSDLGEIETLIIPVKDIQIWLTEILVRKNFLPTSDFNYWHLNQVTAHDISIYFSHGNTIYRNFYFLSFSISLNSDEYKNMNDLDFIERTGLALKQHYKKNNSTTDNLVHEGYYIVGRRKLGAAWHELSLQVVTDPQAYIRSAYRPSGYRYFFVNTGMIGHRTTDAVWDFVKKWYDETLGEKLSGLNLPVLGPRLQQFYTLLSTRKTDQGQHPVNGTMWSLLTCEDLNALFFSADTAQDWVKLQQQMPDMYLFLQQSLKDIFTRIESSSTCVDSPLDSPQL